MIEDLESAVNFAKESFSFLSECGFVLTIADAKPTYNNGKKNRVLYYRGQFKQIEVAIGIDNYHVTCYIRNVINGHYAPYNDKKNSLPASDLLFLDDDGSFYDGIWVAAFNASQRRQATMTQVNFIKPHRKIICSNEWFDTEAIELNRRNYYIKKWGLVHANLLSKITIRTLLSEKTKFLLTEGYHLIEDTELLPPYQVLGWNVVYGNGTNIIDIHVDDWRDAPNTFVISINKTDVFKANLANYPSVHEMTDHFAYVLKEII